MRDCGVQCVVVLTTSSEHRRYLKSRDLLGCYERGGILAHHMPVEEGLPPTPECCLQASLLTKAHASPSTALVIVCALCARARCERWASKAARPLVTSMGVCSRVCSHYYSERRYTAS